MQGKYEYCTEPFNDDDDYDDVDDVDDDDDDVDDDDDDVDDDETNVLHVIAPLQTFPNNLKRRA